MPVRVYYDGDCGLCHRAARFVLAEDRAALIRLAPLGGETFQRELPLADVETLPDSLVLATAEGAVLVRSAGVLRLAARMGGCWRVLAGVGGLVPRPLRDLAYRGVAAVRRQIFPAPSGACPIVTPELMRRFDP